MDKHAIALVLEEIGTLLSIQGENRFKARAFTGAARTVEKLEQDINRLARSNELEGVQGIGPATAGVIRDLVSTGTSRYYLELRERTPPGLLQLLAVPHLGATRIRTLNEELGIRSLDELEQAARAGRIAPLKGFGPRTEQRILDGIADVRGASGRRRYAEAIELGARLRGFVASLPGVQRADLAGELRRGCETVNAVDLVAAVAGDAVDAALETFLALPGLKQPRSVPGRGAIARLPDDLEVRLLCVEPAAYAAALWSATGSAQHLAALSAYARELGLQLSAAGLVRGRDRIEPHDETELYGTLGLPFIAPELRESGEEVEAARRGRLPSLIEYEDLRGCFHCHTTYSDGKASIQQMAEEARGRGWRYLGITDHSQYAGYAGGLGPDDIRRQHIEIDTWNERHGRSVWLFKGIEADILPDGRLDFDDRPDVLASFDFVIGSMHSGFALSREAQTERFLRVLENPYLTFLGHLTGRLLLSRRGADLDLDRILVRAAERGIGIEINSDPHRMELDWRHWPRAKTLGIRTAINPDAHSERQFDFLHHGIVIARKGGLEAADIVNTWTLTDVKRFFRGTRRA